VSFTIAFVGAGSIGFTRKLIGDLLTVPEFDRVELVLQDVSKRNLEMVAELIAKDLAANGSEAKLRTTRDQDEAVAGARYVFNTARVGGLEAFRHDVEIPLRYGVDQCVGDTICAGGIMYGQRGIPMLLGLCRSIEDHAAPGCRLFNYANPMAMMTWAASEATGVDVTGLCHGVQGGHRLISSALGLPQEEVDIVCAGINHQTWYVEVRHRGRDLTGELLAAFENDPDIAAREKVRIDMIRRFGYFSTESNGHLSEYLPWYRKRPGEIPRWIDESDWIHGETGGYLRICTEKRHWFETDFPYWRDGEPRRFVPEARTHEHGSYILEGLETGRIYRGHFNRVNGVTIANLPPDCVIESPGYVDRNGIAMAPVGELPLGCAAVCNGSVQVQRLAKEAALDGDDELLRQAMLLDPLVGAVCDPPEVWNLVDEMLVAQAEWLPQYGKAIDAARRRLRAQVPSRSA